MTGLPPKMDPVRNKRGSHVTVEPPPPLVAECDRCGAILAVALLDECGMCDGCRQVED